MSVWQKLCENKMCRSKYQRGVALLLFINATRAGLRGRERLSSDQICFLKNLKFYVGKCINEACVTEYTMIYFRRFSWKKKSDQKEKWTDVTGFFVCLFLLKKFFICAETLSSLITIIDHFTVTFSRSHPPASSSFHWSLISDQCSDRSPQSSAS